MMQFLQVKDYPLVRNVPKFAKNFGVRHLVQMAAHVRHIPNFNLVKITRKSLCSKKYVTNLRKARMDQDQSYLMMQA